MTTAHPPGTGELPERFGRYRILKKLGQGGMGAVYLARDPDLNRLVALKTPLGDVDAETAERFRRAACTAAPLQHPNICPLYEAGTIDGVPYLTMAYIEGTTLEERLRGGRLPAVQAVELVRLVALALAEAHDHGVVHRDVKPSNILVNRRGEPILTDIGLARGLNAGPRLTPGRTLLGAPAYLPPEQVRGEANRDDRSGDGYSLGVVLYQLLTGRLPFDGPTEEVLFARILNDEPPSPSALIPELDPRLDALCLKAMARDLAERYPDMAAFAAALGPFCERGQEENWSLSLSGGPRSPLTEGDKNPDPPRRPSRRPWRVVAGGAAGSVLALALVYGFIQVGYLQRKFTAPGLVAPPVANTEPVRGGTASAMALLARGREEYRQGLEEEAFADFAEARRLFAAGDAPAHPFLAKDYADRAWCYLRIDRRDDALADCAAALRLDPHCSVAWLTYAQAWHDLGRRDKELEVYAGARKAVRPSTAAEYADFAHIVLALDQPDDANRACDEAAERYPLPSDVFEVRARAGLLKGDKGRAALDYARAAHLLSLHWARDYLERSVLYELGGETDLALADADRALALAPRLAAAFRQRGCIYRAEKNRVRAVADYRQAVAVLTPRYAGGYFDRAWLYNELGDCDRAAADLEKALELGLNSGEVHRELAHACRNLKAYDRARTHLDEAIRLLPADPSLYGERGSLSLAQGHIEDAIKDYTESLRIDPEDAQSYVNRGDAFFQSGDNEHAVEDYTRALGRTPETDHAALADVYDRRGVAFARLAKYREATADYNRAIENDPGDPVLYRNRAAARLRAGDDGAAAADVRKAEELQERQP